MRGISFSYRAIDRAGLPGGFSRLAGVGSHRCGDDGEDFPVVLFRVAGREFSLPRPSEARTDFS